MAKLTKPQIKAHARAIELLKQDRLTIDEREFVLENWQEAANHINSAAGAFFTPLGLAWDFSIDVGGLRILDLCAGIGALSYAMFERGSFNRSRDEDPKITCVEVNPDYVEVGRKIVPEATWICGDIFDLPDDLGRFDWVIANPPFGKIGGKADFDLAVVELAERYADNATFILPAGSVPWRFSGQRGYDPSRPSDKAVRFRDRTKIELRPGCGVDCDFYRDQWRGAAPAVEIALADYEEARSQRPAAPAAQADLFGAAA